MGYTTDFYGSFKLSRTLTLQEYKFIKKFNESRRMKRDVNKLQELYKGKDGLPLIFKKTPEMEEHIEFFEKLGIEVTLKQKTDKRTPEEIYGKDGEFFVGDTERDESVIDYNVPPSTQPGLWCQWVVNDFEDSLEWDGGEKFYNYVEWLEYLIENFFQPWGVILNGEVKWEGEDNEDIGKIVVVDNIVEVKKAVISYE